MAVVIRELWEAFSMSILMESAMGTESDILIWGERWMIENNEEETYQPRKMDEHDFDISCCVNHKMLKFSHIHGLYFKPDYVYYVQNQHVLRIIQMLCRLRVHCSQVPLLHIKVAKFLSFVFPYRTLLRSIYPSANPLFCTSFIISFYFSSVYSFVSLYQRFHNTLCVSPYISTP